MSQEDAGESRASLSACFSMRISLRSRRIIRAIDQATSFARFSNEAESQTRVSGEPYDLSVGSFVALKRLIRMEVRAKSVHCYLSGVPCRMGPAGVFGDL